MTGQKIYIVTREGIYRHEILGLFDARHEAEIHAAVTAEHDEDNYHTYLVSEIEVNIGKEDTEPLIYFRKGMKPKKAPCDDYLV